jgi:hypothetical protein
MGRKLKVVDIVAENTNNEASTPETVSTEQVHEVTPDVEEGIFVIGPVGIEGEEGEGIIACVSGAGENQAASATAAKITEGAR